MNFPREAGILLHPTSLPGPYGMGEIGPAAYAWADTLKEMGCHLWQVLPLGPTSYGDSPYQSPSTFAGNHLLISFDLLVEDGLLHPSHLKKLPALPDDHVEYGEVIPARNRVLATVCRTFNRRATEKQKQEFETFCHREGYWLNDYALFMALKEAHGGGPWTDWPRELADRDPDAMRQARRTYRVAIRNVKIQQFLVHDQWHRLRTYCHRRRVRIVGDIPIFVAHDSADVWAHRELYFLEPSGHPSVVAGVPPDYFSATGQLWGNPLYNWEVHRSTDYAWWAARLRKIFQMVDIVRIDHFRGFEAYWEIPAGEETAMNGQWVKGPDADLFECLNKQFKDLPIIAEDLGIITDEVEALRDRFAFPGMRVLQFAFGNDAKANDYLPENVPENCVVYTGTHDNDTTVGWFWSNAGENSTRTQEEIENERATILAYLKSPGEEIHWDLMAAAAGSRANTVVFPVQDVLGWGSEARMNVPGKESGNWQWRLPEDALTPSLKERMRSLLEWSNRIRH